MHFTLADLVADIAQNAAESGADRVELEINESFAGGGTGEFRFTVKDNGKGMTKEELLRSQDPFATDGIKHPHRKVGLGLPFMIQTAEQSGGGWNMESRKRPEAGPLGEGGKAPEGSFGTEVSAWFDLGNVDTPPTGDIPQMFRTVLLFEGPLEIVIKRGREKPEGRIDYELRKTELTGALGEMESAQSLILLDHYVRSLETGEDEE